MKAEPHLTSVQAAKLLGVGPTSVKRWADSGLLQCARTPGRHRRFTREEIERFRAERQAPGGLDTAEIADWLQLLSKHSSALDLHAALMRERGRHGSWARVGDRFADLLRELGRRWSRGEWSILEEHAASEALLRGIARCSESIHVGPGAPVCLLAAAVGEEHTLPLFLAELCLRECGWQTQWSGRSTPTSEILAAIETGSVNMVALSSSGAASAPEDLARQALELERSCQEHGVELVLGGSGAWPNGLSHALRPARFMDFHAMLSGSADTIPAARVPDQRTTFSP